MDPFSRNSTSRDDARRTATPQPRPVAPLSQPVASQPAGVAAPGPRQAAPEAQQAVPQVQQVVAEPHQQEAANVIRSQLNSIYNGQTYEGTSPYERTHEEHPQAEADQWKAYHSAWQTYYQKYYEAYYAHQATLAQPQSGTAQAGATSMSAAQAGPLQTGAAPQQRAGTHADPRHAQLLHYFSQHSGSSTNTAQNSAGTDSQPVDTVETLTKDQALFELRQKLLGRVREQATRVRRSRHFIPITAALVVMLVFVFLQYNQVLFATVNAYVSPGAIDPQNIVIDPSKGTSVSQDPRLIIPKINVDVPVLYDVGSDYNSQMAAMQKGVAHFAIPGADSHPGEVGNTVLSGHSSNDLFDPGDYKFIFAQLEKLQIGDTIYANYKGTRYTYVVTKTEVVQPTDVSKLVYATTKPILTLITCTPLGTSRNRLLVTAEQVSPDPATATSDSSSSKSESSATTIPGGSSPTLLERLFGAQ